MIIHFLQVPAIVRLFFFFSNNFYRMLSVDFCRIQTQIVKAEGEHGDN